ncbi:hypothetical protein Ancab_000706 [Ancistrocladus abbreviatus]
MLGIPLSFPCPHLSSKKPWRPSLSCPFFFLLISFSGFHLSSELEQTPGLLYPSHLSPPPLSLPSSLLREPRRRRKVNASETRCFHHCTTPVVASQLCLIGQDYQRKKILKSSSALIIL